MRKLKQRYVVFSRAGQLNLWDDLLHIKCNESTAAAEVSASFRNKIIDLAEAGLTLTEDNIMGLMFHSSLTRGSPLRQEFDHRVGVTGVSSGAWGMSSQPSFCILRIILHIAHFA
jgi:hypothetical protein